MTTLPAPAARVPRAPSGERRVPLLAAFALATLLTACANEPAASAGARGGEAPVAADEPRASPIAMSPREGPPGTDVTLELGGLVMNANVEIGFGDLTQHEIIASAEGDAEGRVTATVPVPASAPPGTYYFFIAQADGPPLAVSDPFVVTAP